MTEQVERLIERLNFGNACQAPEANESRCGQCQCCQRAQAATTIERLSAEKAALEKTNGNLPAKLKAAAYAAKTWEQYASQADSRADTAESQLAEARGALEEARYYISGRLTGDPEWMPDTLYAKIVAALALPAEQGEE